MADIRENGILQAVELTSTFGSWREETNSAIEILNSANSINSANTLVYRDSSGNFSGQTVNITNLDLGSAVTNIVPDTTGSKTLGTASIKWDKLFIGGSSVSQISFDSGTRFAVPIAPLTPAPGTTQANTGSIVFNFDSKRFEGHNGSAFSSLGATIDGDDDTTIVAEIATDSDEDVLSFYAGSADDALMEISDAGIVIKKVVGFSSNTQLRIPASITGDRRGVNQNVSRGTLTLDQTGAGTGDHVYVLQTTGSDTWIGGIRVNIGDVLEINDTTGYHYFRVISIQNSDNDLVLKFVEKRSLLTYAVTEIFPVTPTLLGFTSVFRIQNFIGDIRYNSDVNSQHIEYVSSLDPSSREERWNPIGGADIQRLQGTLDLGNEQFTFDFATLSPASGEAGPTNLAQANKDVYLNGVKQLEGADFTVSGNIVSVAGGTLNVGDDMEVVVYDSFRVSNHYTKNEWTNGGITIGSITSSGTITASAFATSSLRSLKENIVDIESPMDKVMKLRGVEFDWKSNGNHELGFIQDEVESVEKDLTTDEGVKYSNITALLVEAMKEQQKEIEELKMALKRK